MEVLTANAALVACLMLLLWLLSLRRSDVSIVDIAWGLGFVLIAWNSYLLADGQGWRQGLLVALTTIWGLRLSLYLAWRNHGQPEDFRYREMRERYGRKFPWLSLYLVFGLQGGLMWLISLPLQVGQLASSPAGLTVVNLIGVIVWLVGFLFESIGDFQLARFKANPANQGRVMDRGLWRYTRHPNYFGDFLVWWGLFAVSLSGLGTLWTVVSPIVMTVLLVRISGVALLEKKLKSRSPEFVDYARRTSAFLPWPPKTD
jgi:steroid 5-alpha reductase family enzyme